jgi:hypothetical protein
MKDIKNKKNGYMKQYKMLFCVLSVFLTTILVSCGENGDPSSPESEPPPYNSALFLGTWNGTNMGTINGSGITITFTAIGLTESWTAKDGPRSYTTRFDVITPLWNYRNDTKLEYPSGYAFQGTVTHTVNSYELKSKTWHTFYLNKNNASIMYDNSDTYAVFVK